MQHDSGMRVFQFAMNVVEHPLARFAAVAGESTETRAPIAA